MATSLLEKRESPERSLPVVVPRPVRRPPVPVVLGAIVVAVTGLDVLWRLEERRPPHWDMARHLGDSLVYLHAFSLAHPLRFVETYVYYPPFAYWVADAFYAALGNQAMWVAVLSNVVFIGMLVLSTYGIGKTLWSPSVGLLAAFFTVTTPMLTVAFKDYMLDAPLTAVVALALYLLIRSEGFSRTRYALALGLACGCGVLVKWTFPFALALPVVVALLAAARGSLRERSPRRLANVAGAALLALAVAGPWYLHNLAQIRHDLTYNNGPAGVIRGSPPIASAASVVWYLWDLVGVQLYLVPALLLAVGVVFLFLKEEAAGRNFYPVLTVVGTYVGFTLLRNKDARFTDPMLPAVAVIATSWLAFLGARLRVGLAAAIAAYGAVAFLAISFGTGLLPRNVSVRLGTSPYLGNLPTLTDGTGDGIATGKVTLFAQHGYLIGQPTSENWHQEDVFRAIAAAPRGERTFVFEGGDSMWFNTWGTRYYALRYGATWIGQLDVARFLIVRGPPSGPVPPSFHLTASYALPDGEPLALYRRA